MGEGGAKKRQEYVICSRCMAPAEKSLALEFIQEEGRREERQRGRDRGREKDREREQKKDQREKK